MAPRCPGGSPHFLPFLYPALFLSRASGSSRLAAAAVQVRHHISEPASGEQPTSRLDPRADDYYVTNFADKAKLRIYAGAGGGGCISFAREAYLPDGPPNGGDGGHGGNVYIQAVHGETSLHKLARRRFIRATRGTNGQGSNKAGKRGEDVIITVPVGTVVRELSREDPEVEEQYRQRLYKRNKALPKPEDDSTDAQRDRVSEEPEYDNPELEKWILYPGIASSEKKKILVPDLPARDKLFAQPRAPIQLDLSKPMARPVLLAAGALGGLGNPHFSSRERPRPLFATKGDKAISMEIELELKLLADVGLVGLPNAGKSTLVRALTNSRARVGSWAFTTLQPNIGTVVLDNNRGRPVVKSYHHQDVQDSWDGDTEVVQRTRFTIADIPGLIEGAHLDKGLGIAFLRHVERAGVLAFVVDLSAGDAVKALKALWNEVGLYAQMREEEEQDREREARIEKGLDPDAEEEESQTWAQDWPIYSEYPNAPGKQAGLNIAAKPWFVIATKGDLPNTQENFKSLREYLTRVTNGDELHPSGVEGAWVKDCAAIPVSALKGQGVERIIHWTVGLLDG
ncbi:hypothetical protein KVR01_003198 [Diaporthe batatas]|uniref:uncharacterized protein n=1 Tax=Diaporthe batatas TaxID=748121 RepID=UPI001D04B535|nr:uncharacterized protein KVR01_003198 [Diaporthe batatas]KAG8167509.1 hypothetical protein KVR01_003198 [Diaporthe batatas]